MIQLGAKINLVICQKSKIDDWVEHFRTVPNTDGFLVDDTLDLTDKKQYQLFCNLIKLQPDNIPPRYMVVGIINYELAFRRPELAKLKNFTLMLDESSLIQNEHAKRSAFILKKLHPTNIILLSGTPTGGKYEKLWSQLHLLGWRISKKMFYEQYVQYHYETYLDFPLIVIDGYKNEERLKRKMRQHGCHFLKTDEVFDLPVLVDQKLPKN